MPSEPADERPAPQGVSLNREIEDFCRQYPHVTILNTSDPYLRSQLVAWSPEFALAAWPMLKGQRQTLEALERFAIERNAHVNFRLESWARALSDLGNKKNPPDVAQVGSTWLATLAATGLLEASPSEGLGWRSVAGMPGASLPYTTDPRLIFYWRRPLGSSSAAPLFNPTSDSWPSFLKSLQDYVKSTGSKPIAFPIGLTQNLLHDYAGLVWAGGGDILHMGGWRTYIKLTDKQSLAIPLLLASTAVVTRGGQPYRLLAFPEMDHEEATRHFMAGDYLGVIEPAAFIRRWFDNFVQRDPNPSTPQERLVREREFWDYARVGVLPETFKGGSDLVVLRTTRVPDLAFSLASFLTHDKDFTEHMGSIGWLPAQLKDHGLEALRASLWHCEPSAEPCHNPPDGLADFDRVVQLGLEKGREYPQYARWPAAFESRETLDDLQNLWRAIGQADESEIGAAAAATELSINRQIDWWTRVKERVRQALFLILIAGIPVVWLELGRRRRIAIAERERAGALAERAEAEKQRAEAQTDRARVLEKLHAEEAAKREALQKHAEALERTRKLAGAAGLALVAFNALHDTLHEPNPFYTKDARPVDAEKALLVDALVESYRRAEDQQYWQKAELSSIIWRAILLAMRSVRAPLLFKQWEREGRSDIETFLRQHHRIRSEQDSSLSNDPYFEVKCPPSLSVALPFVLEQVLICLMQNAIQPPAAGDPSAGDEPPYRPTVVVTVEDAVPERVVSVFNKPKRLPRELCSLINDARDLADFDCRVDTLLRGVSTCRPGLGLVQAYWLATQFYRGLHVDVNATGTDFLIKL
jgi:hypothetical protein